MNLFIENNYHEVIVRENQTRKLVKYLVDNSREISVLVLTFTKLLKSCLLTIFRHKEDVNEK